MKGPPPVDAVVKNKSTVGNPGSWRHPQNRRMPAFAALHPESVSVEQLMDRPHQLLVVLKAPQRLSNQRRQLRLNGVADRSLEPIELLLEVGQHRDGVSGIPWVRGIHGACGPIGADAFITEPWRRGVEDCGQKNSRIDRGFLLD